MKAGVPECLHRRRNWIMLNCEGHTGCNCQLSRCSRAAIWKEVLNALLPGSRSVYYIHVEMSNGKWVTVLKSRAPLCSLVMGPRPQYTCWKPPSGVQRLRRQQVTDRGPYSTEDLFAISKSSQGTDRRAVDTTSWQKWEWDGGNPAANQWWDKETVMQCSERSQSDEANVSFPSFLWLHDSDSRWDEMPWVSLCQLKCVSFVLLINKAKGVKIKGTPQPVYR